MMRRGLFIVGLLVLSSCHGGGHGSRSDAKPKRRPSKVVPFDPAFTAIEGSWRSAPDTGGLPQGRFLQLDIASNGDYSAEIRRLAGQSVEVLEDARGHASRSAGGLTGTLAPGSRGATLSSLAPWRAQLAPDSKSMTLTPAKGLPFILSWRSR